MLALGTISFKEIVRVFFPLHFLLNKEKGQHGTDSITAAAAFLICVSNQVSCVPTDILHHATDILHQ